MTDHAHELRRYSRKVGRPAGDVPSVMLAAADEIERLAARLEAAEKERDALREQMERQEPVAWLDDGTCRAGSKATAHRVVTNETKRDMPASVAASFSVPLCALHGAKGEAR